MSLCKCSTEKPIIEVTFKNGTKHLKQTCPMCEKYTFVAREKSDKKIKNESIAKKAKFGASFYTSEPWLRLRYKVLALNERICVLCGSKEKPFHIDHIRPRLHHPELALEITNLQILCAACNMGKSADYDHDFRP